MKIEAIGVNYADVAVRLGVYDAVKDYPMSPGFDIAGRVVARGDAVRRHDVGDRVFGAVRFGAYAEEANAGEDLVWSLPEGFSFEDGAAIPVNYGTAWYALVELGRARAGERVLIHSAAGGVGLAAAQLARMLELDAVGVVGRRNKVEAATSFGCRRVVAAEDGDIWRQLTDEAPFDIVLDANGPSTLKQSYRALAPRGRLVSYGFASMLSRGRDRLNWPALAWRFLRTPRFAPFDMVMSNKSVAGFNLVHLFEDANLRQLIGDALVETIGREDFVKPPVTVFDFEEPAKAHAWLEAGTSIGKAVLRVTS